jgi:hypothetical protein
VSVGVGGAEQGVPFRLVGSRRFPYANIFWIVRFRSILLSEFRSVQNRSPIVQLERPVHFRLVSAQKSNSSCSAAQNGRS